MSEKMLKFVDLGQQSPPKRQIKDRKEDFNEIYKEFISLRQKSSLVDVRNAVFLSAKYTAPLSNNIPDWLKLTAEGSFEEAYQLFTKHKQHAGGLWKNLSSRSIM